MPLLVTTKKSYTNYTMAVVRMSNAHKALPTRVVLSHVVHGASPCFDSQEGIDRKILKKCRRFGLKKKKKS